MSVHYKFKSALEYDTVTFDGLHISIADLKAAIIQQKRIGKTSDFDLQVTNAQTKEVYTDNNTLIPKNTSLLVARIPLTQQVKKSWDGVAGPVNTRLEPVAAHKGTTDLSRMEGSEDDKIMAMISQSTLDYDPSNYQKIRGANQRGEVPPNYRCYRCQEPGHWIKNCPLGTGADQLDIKRSTGIPRSFMVPVEGPSAPGAMMTPTGAFAVPVVDHEAYRAEESLMESGTGSAMNAPEPPPRQEIREDLQCSLCHDLLRDAVMIPCCGNSFCDECIRGVLLESEDHECPDCRETDISPVTLIPNRYLRNSVITYCYETGYCPRPRPPTVPKSTIDTQTTHDTDSGQHPDSKDINGPSTGKNLTSEKSPDTHREADQYDDSDGSYEDNITVKVPQMVSSQGYNKNEGSNATQHGPSNTMQPSVGGSGNDMFSNQRPSNLPQYGMHPNARLPLKPPGMETPPNQHHNMMVGEERPGTPTVDEREQRVQMPPMHLPSNHLQPPAANFPHVPPGPFPPPHNRPISFDYTGTPPLAGPPPTYGQPLPHYPTAYQPLPPGAPGPPGLIEDPLEAFERMIREKEEKARRRDKRSRTRTRSSSRSRSITRSRYTRSRSRSRNRSRTPFSRSRSRSRPGSGRSPGGRRIGEKYRSYSRSPGPRRVPPPLTRRKSRDRRSNSFSISRSRSVSRSHSPRSGRPLRRRGSPGRYRSPLRTPPPQGLPHQRQRFPGASYKGPARGNSQERVQVPPNGPRLQRHYAGYGAGSGPGSVAGPHNRYNQRNNGPPGNHPQSLMAMKTIPPGIEPVPRMRYGPAFEDIPPGTQPPPPGFEHPPIDRRDEIIPPGINERNRERDRPVSSYRDQRLPFRDGPPQSFKDGPPMGFREGPPNFREGPQPFRENMNPGFRDHSSSNFRDGPSNFREGQPPGFRDGPPPGFRDGPPFREGPPQVFRDGPQNIRDGPGIPPYREAPANYRDNGPPFRDGSAHIREGPPQVREGPHSRDNINHTRDNFPHARDTSHSRDNSSYVRDGAGHKRNVGHNRDGHPRNNNSGNRDNTYVGHEKTNRDHSKHDYVHDRNREYREQERYREGDRRDREYDRNREDRHRDHEKGRDVSEREKEHGYYVNEKRRKLSSSPRRESKEDRSKGRIDSRGRSRESTDYRKETKKEHDKEKKFDDDKSKDRDKKIKDKKKKKKEKDDKRKKKEKRDKKEKADSEKAEGKSEEDKVSTQESKIVDTVENKSSAIPNIGIPDLYNDILPDIDRNIMEAYVKDPTLKSDDKNEKSSFDIEAKFNNPETKVDSLEIGKEKGKNEVLAPLPELSKWEIDDEQSISTEAKDSKDVSSPTVKSGKVTSEVLKRAENAIFAKAINAIKAIEIKKISSDRVKLYSNESADAKSVIFDKDSKKEVSDIHITIPSNNLEHRSVEINESRKTRHDKTPPPKLSVKERLGGKIEEPSRRVWDERVLHSTVERIKSRSKTPQNRRFEKDSRKVTLDSSRERGGYRRVISKIDEIDIHGTDYKNIDDVRKDDKKSHSERYDSHSQHDRKKLHPDETNKSNHSPARGSKVNRDDNEKKDRIDKHRNRSMSSEKKSIKKRDKKHKKEKDDRKAKKDNAETGELNKDAVNKIIHNDNSTMPSNKETVTTVDRDRKKSSLDEASFEPDYDETVESETETKDFNENQKKLQPKTPEKSENKVEPPTIQLDLNNVRKRQHTESSSSSSDSSSSSSSSGSGHKRRRKKRTKAKKKKSRQWKESGSDSDNSSSDEPKKKKKKRKNKKKAMKKKKKSKHK